jgi:hypothetical protein
MMARGGRVNPVERERGREREGEREKERKERAWRESA